MKARLLEEDNRMIATDHEVPDVEMLAINENLVIVSVR